MFDWIKKLFETKNEFPQPPEDTYELTEDGLKITRWEPRPYYGDPKRTYRCNVTHISEPIYSFGEAVKTNPKRFKVKHPLLEEKSIGYLIVDLETGMTFTARQYVSLVFGNVYYSVDNHPWVTPSESRYLWDVFNKVYKQRRERLNQIKRDRLKKVYCENKKKPCPTPPPCRIIREGRD